MYHMYRETLGKGIMGLFIQTVTGWTVSLPQSYRVRFSGRTHTKGLSSICGKQASDFLNDHPLHQVVPHEARGAHI